MRSMNASGALQAPSAAALLTVGLGRGWPETSVLRRRAAFVQFQLAGEAVATSNISIKGLGPSERFVATRAQLRSDTQRYRECKPHP